MRQGQRHSRPRELKNENSPLQRQAEMNKQTRKGEKWEEEICKRAKCRKKKRPNTAKQREIVVDAISGPSKTQRVAALCSLYDPWSHEPGAGPTLVQAAQQQQQVG